MSFNLFKQVILVPLIMFGFFSKASAKSPDFRVGQVWSIQSGDYQGAEVVIVNMENHPIQKKVIHIMVLGPLRNSDGKVTSTISHLPYSQEGLRRSDLKLSRKGVVVPDDWQEGYSYWNEEALKGKAGMFSVPVSEAIDFAFQQMPPSGRE